MYVYRDRDLAAQVETVEDPLRLHVLAARLRLDALGWPRDRPARSVSARFICAMYIVLQDLNFRKPLGKI